MCIIMSAARLISKKFKLTPRETDVLLAIVDLGPDKKTIAEKYSLSPATTYKYIKNIYDKTDTGGMGELLHLVMKEASYFDSYLRKDDAETEDFII